jgi:hypothetical protein
MWGRTTVAAALSAGALTGAGVAGASDPQRDYDAVRSDWQSDRVITACRFTLEQLENARSMASPEDGYTDFGDAIAREIGRQRSGGCPGGGGPEGRPVVSRLRVVPAAFRAARGAQIHFGLSKPARVRIVVERLGPRGRRVGTLVRRGREGANRALFRGRLGGRPLPPGRYRLTAVATDGDEVESRPRRAGFRVQAG